MYLKRTIYKIFNVLNNIFFEMEEGIKYVINTALSRGAQRSFL